MNNYIIKIKTFILKLNEIYNLVLKVTSIGIRNQQVLDKKRGSDDKRKRG